MNYSLINKKHPMAYCVKEEGRIHDPVYIEILPDVLAQRWSLNLGQPAGLIKVGGVVHGYTAAGRTGWISRPL